MFEHIEVGKAAAWESNVEDDELRDGEEKLNEVMDELRPHKTEKSRVYAKVRRYFDKKTSRLYAETHEQIAQRESERR